MQNELVSSTTDASAPGETETSPSCLALHGLGGGPYEIGPLIDALKADGLRVEAPVLPGHEPVGPIMPASSWRDWATASEAAFDALAAAGGPVVVIGFSTGGTLALRLATRRPVARMVLLAPFLAIRYSGLIPLRPASYLRHLAKLIPDLPRRPPAVRDPVMRRWAASHDGFRTFNLHATISALELIDEVKSLVCEITTPTLIIQGRLDTVVEPSNARWLYRQLGATTKAADESCHAPTTLSCSIATVIVPSLQPSSSSATARSRPRHDPPGSSRPGRAVSSWSSFRGSPPTPSHTLLDGGDAMSENPNLADIGQRLEQRFGVNRSLLLGVGLACVLLGIIAMALPLKLFGSLIRLLGVLLLIAAGVKAFQLLLGRGSAEARRRGWPLIACEVALDASMGLLLLNHWRFSAEVAAAALGLLFAVEGVVLVYVALRSPSVTSRRWMTLCGLVTTAAGLAILLRLVADPLAWAGVLVGLKLMLFGVSLVWIATAGAQVRLGADLRGRDARARAG